MVGVIVVVAVVVVLALIIVAMYNGLVGLRQQSENAWSQIDVQLKRRYDLIPNLVETVKGYMKYEQETLQKVIEARSSAMNAKSVGERSEAENQLGSALGSFFALAESYPDLKASQNMLSLQEELKSTENKISFARQYYNDIVTQYNTRLQTFPSAIIASGFGFQPKERFELQLAAEREPVKVQF